MGATTLVTTDVSIYLVAIIGYLMAQLGYLGDILYPNRKRLGFWASIILLGAFLVHLTSTCLRWYTAGRPPISNSYEATNWFVLMIVFSYLVFEFRFKNHKAGLFALTPALLMALVSLRFESSLVPLIPALQSYWLKLHVSTTIAGYGLFTVAAGLGVAYLLRENWERRFAAENSPPLRELMQTEMAASFPQAEKLDYFSFWTIGLGLPTFAFGGLIMGSLWAYEAWGAYWSWDPKETWALIVFLYYSFYVHARLTSGWGKRLLAWMNIIGFGVLLFTFFGVNFLLSGLHSYA